MELHAEQPMLLMLSHCVPDALGNADRARVWQLLRLVGRTHQVRLLCRLDAPTSIEQWRAAHALTKRLVIQMPATRLDPMSFLRPRTRDLGLELRDIAPSEGVDILLCTHPSLMAAASRIDARLKVCDVDTPAFVSTVAANRHAATAEDLTESCDILTAGHPSYVDEAGVLPRRAIVLPEAIDLESFPLRAAAHEESEAPLLVFHSQWQDRSAIASLAWFRRNVWPTIQKAVPAARFAHTTPIGHRPFAGTIDLLRAAAIVVTPEANPRLARWPVLQAMATQRPVIAAPPALHELGARDGEHLLAAHGERDWSRLCIESLRSAGSRIKIARAARAFLELNTAYHAGREILHALAPRPAVALARAA